MVPAAGEVRPCVKPGSGRCLGVPASPPLIGELETHLPIDTLRLQFDPAGIRCRHGPGPQPRATISMGWHELLGLFTNATSLNDVAGDHGNAVEVAFDFVNRLVGWLTSNETTRTDLGRLSGAVI